MVTGPTEAYLFQHMLPVDSILIDMRFSTWKKKGSTASLPETQEQFMFGALPKETIFRDQFEVSLFQVQKLSLNPLFYRLSTFK